VSEKSGNRSTLEDSAGRRRTDASAGWDSAWHSAPQKVGAWIGDAARLPQIGEASEQLPLFLGQIGRGEHTQLVQQVAGRILAASRQALPAQPHHAAALAIRGDFQRD